MDGEAADPVAWLRAAVTERLELARKASAGPWSSWIEGRDHCGGDSFIQTAGDYDMTVNYQVREYGPKGIAQWQADQDYIAANDPQDTIARCEAELAILDEHGPTDWTAYGDHMCRRCHRPREEAREDEDQCEWLVYPCRTVRFLFGAYRFRSGYDAAWGVLAGR